MILLIDFYDLLVIQIRPTVITTLLQSCHCMNLLYFINISECLNKFTLISVTVIYLCSR